MMHWSAQYLGARWSPDGTGPSLWSCWGLVRHVLREQFGCDLPMVPCTATDPDFAPARVIGVARAMGWSIVMRDLRGVAPALLDAFVKDGDVVVMRGLDRAHVGIVAKQGRRAHLLHADGTMVDEAPVGEVVCVPISDALEGYLTAELWRHVELP